MADSRKHLMPRCRSCSAELPNSGRFCSSCGAASSASSEGETVALPVSLHPAAGERFVPGLLIAERYRIVARLGKGGVGAVYRADDLTLGEPVALKFLSDAMAHDLSALARLHSEVRVARQITHPNVCRVYDIGDLQG